MNILVLTLLFLAGFNIVYPVMAAMESNDMRPRFQQRPHQYQPEHR